MTLTEFSYYLRRFLPFVVIFFLLIMVLYYLVKVFLLYFNAEKPKTLYINPIFGKITKPYIENASSSANLNFTIDTIEGEPVSASDSAKIYYLPSSSAKFGYREKIYLIAKTLGFNTDVVNYKLNDKEAVFEDSKQKLTIDITNYNFTYEYKFEDDQEIFQKTIVPEKNTIEDTAVNFLKTIGRYPEELSRGKTNTIYIIYDPISKKMSVSDTNQNTNIMEVDLYRPDLENTIVTPTYFNSQNYVMMVFYANGYKIIKAQVKFFEKSETQYGIYPLISGNDAWNELKNGNGIVVQNSQTGGNIVIKKMFLGYLDPDVYQEYLQPVYVFLGQNDFVGYVPAVSSSYLIK